MEAKPPSRWTIFKRALARAWFEYRWVHHWDGNPPRRITGDGYEYDGMLGPDGIDLNGVVRVRGRTRPKIAIEFGSGPPQQQTDLDPATILYVEMAGSPMRWWKKEAGQWVQSSHTTRLTVHEHDVFLRVGGTAIRGLSEVANHMRDSSGLDPFIDRWLESLTEDERREFNAFTGLSDQDRSWQAVPYNDVYLDNEPLRGSPGVSGTPGMPGPVINPNRVNPVPTSRRAISLDS
jgi:hypothetical protein